MTASPRVSRVNPEAVSDASRAEDCAGGSTPEQELFANLLRSHDCIWSEQGRFFGRFGITPQQYNVLNVLALHDVGHGVACQAIAENLLNRVPDITRLLDRLEQAGYIRRERCAADRRVVRTHLTETGRAKVEAIRGPLHAALRTRFGHLSATEMDELNRLLNKIREPGCSHARGAFELQDHEEP